MVDTPLPDTIVVDVDYYDDAEKKKLQAFPTASAIESLVGKPLHISKAEFLTYYLFHRIKLGSPGYRDYDSVASRIGTSLGAIGECVDFEHGTVRTPGDFTQQLTEVTEHIGESIGLSVVGRIHGLTEADWQPIPEQKGRGAKPSFDFQIASDGETFVQVETKGSSVANNRDLSNAVKAQKSKIDEKKAKLAALSTRGEDPNPASLRYGTITVVDARPDGNVRCLLTDPPPELMRENPKAFRTVSRLRHLRDWISFLSPRSPFAAALATRVADLEAIGDSYELDGVPLLRGSGEPFAFEPYGLSHWGHSSFMATKSRVTNGPAGGVVIQLSRRLLFLFGIRESLLTIAADQDFEKILTFNAEVGSTEKTVECTFSERRFTDLDLPASVRESARKSGGYFHFLLSGILNYSREGLVFGILPLPEE